MEHDNLYSSVIRRERQVVLVGKINGKARLLSAARHNLREIQAELGANSHIDPSKTHHNIVCLGGRTSREIMEHAEMLLRSAGIEKLRKDAVYAVEYIFSLPPETSIDFDAYFNASLEWLKDYVGCPILSAVTHLDEGAPHMHVLALPLVDDKMQGSAVVGYKSKLCGLKQSHYETVARRFGISRSGSWTKKQKHFIAEQAYSLFSQRPEVLAKPDVRYALIQAMIKDPTGVQVALSITPPEIPQKMRTMTQIFTSTGKGTSRRQDLR